MYTYQDLIQINPDDELKRMAFVRSVISDHKASDAYKMAITAIEYDKKRNVSIMKYQKTLRTLEGREVPDIWSPNHKTTKSFFNFFTSQQNQYLLGNGVTWKKEDTKDRLGKDFDTQLQEAGKNALVQGESFGFWNYDHLEVFELKEFAPIYDEENGALMAGVRFWQIDATKPLRATLYEIDGYTGYIWGEKDPSGKVNDGGRIYRSKTPYIVKTRTSNADGVEIYDGLNYPTFPIVPLWANKYHQSELVGIQEGIDAYDLIKNGFLNDLDTAQIYWVLKGAGGMDDLDAVKFLERIHMAKIANLDADQDAEPVTVDIPHAAREVLLDRIKADLFEDYQALNTAEIRSGAATATEILAAYEPLNNKADQYEYQIVKFLQGILKIAGIDDDPSFTRSKLVNVTEEIASVMQAASALDDEYVTKKVLTLFGDADQAEEVIERMEADELKTGEVTTGKKPSMYEVTSILGKLKRKDITQKTAMSMLKMIGLSADEALRTIEEQVND